MPLTPTESYIKREEGYRRHMYKCTAGKTTIGIGLNLEAGLPEDEAEAILRLRLDKLRRELAQALPWFADLNEARQAALLSMSFQMGLKGALGFKTTLALMAKDKWAEASRQMLSSKWAGQTPARAKRTAYMVRYGKFPEK